MIRFIAPSQTVVGGGAANQLPSIVSRLQAKRALLVADPFLIETGLAARLADGLAECGIAANIFADVRPDPRDIEVIAAGNLRGIGAVKEAISLSWDLAEAVLSIWRKWLLSSPRTAATSAPSRVPTGSPAPACR